MAQGAIKQKSKSTASSRRPSKTTKPGPRVIAPKKASLIKQRKLTKKLSSGLIAKTERSLGERAGHLELLMNAKREKRKEKMTQHKKVEALRSGTVKK